MNDTVCNATNCVTTHTVHLPVLVMARNHGNHAVCHAPLLGQGGCLWCLY